MKVVVRLLDGPVAGKTFMTPDFKPELKFVTAKPQPWKWTEEDGPTLPTIDLEHHCYEAVEVTVIYRHRGTDTRS